VKGNFPIHFLLSLKLLNELSSLWISSGTPLPGLDLTVDLGKMAHIIQTLKVSFLIYLFYLFYF